MALTSREMLVAYGVRQQSTKFAIDADGIITYTRGPGNAGEDAWASILEDAAPGASTAQAPSTAPPASAAPSPAAIAPPPAPTAPPPAPTSAPRPSPTPQPTVAPQPTPTTPPPPTPAATPEPEVAVGNKVGNRAPDFQVTTVDGVTVTPADLEGKPYILYFFATW